MRERSFLIPVGLAAIALIVFLRFVGKNAKAEMSEQTPLRAVAVALAERSSISDTITLSGEFRPFQEVDVHAKVAGYIRKIYVDVGDHVKTGQTLAILEIPELDTQLQGASQRSAAVGTPSDAPGATLIAPSRCIRPLIWIMPA